MGRNMASAKAAGARFNRSIADGFATALADPNIQVAPSWGAKDKGDIVNVRIDGHDLVIQTKDLTTERLAGGVAAAKVQAVNANALAGFYVHKRKGSTDPMQQYVTSTVAELVAMINKIPVHVSTQQGATE